MKKKIRDWFLTVGLQAVTLSFFRVSFPFRIVSVLIVLILFFAVFVLFALLVKALHRFISLYNQE